jgi:hypothetical protein
VLSVLPRLTACNYLFGIFWSLYCLSFLDLRLVITSLVSFGHCVVCPSSTYGLWLPLVSFGHCVVCPSSTYGLWLPLWFLQSFLFYFFYIFMFIRSHLKLQTPDSFRIHYRTLFHFYLKKNWLEFRFRSRDFSFNLFPVWQPYCWRFWNDIVPMHTSTINAPFGSVLTCIYKTYKKEKIEDTKEVICLSFLDLRLVITSLVSFGHCVVCPSSTYGLWLPLWYLLVFVLFVLPRFTDSDYPFAIFKLFIQHA